MDTAYQQKQTYGYMALVELLRLAFRDVNFAKRVIADLIPDDMPDIEHKRIYKLIEEQVATDKISLFAIEAKLAEFIGGDPANILIGKIESTKPLNEEYHKLIEYVKTATKWRLFRDVSYEMGDWKNITDIDQELGDWIPRLQAVLDTATDPTNTTATVAELLPEFVADIQRLTKLEHDITGFATGFKELDEAINGLEPATITVIGAKTSIGKSLVGLNLAIGAMSQVHHDLKRQPKCAFFTLEMSKKQVLRRLLANIGKVPFSKLKKPKLLNKQEWANFTNGIAKMKALPLSIIEGGKTVEQICGEARRLHIKGLLDFVVIDHLHNIRHSGNGNPQAEIKHITGRLVDLKNELNIPIILLAQCNRAAGTSKAPTKENLEGAGAIEQDADNIIMLHRADKYLDPSDESKPRTNIIEFISGKEREGEPFYLQYGFDGCYQRLTDKSEVATPFGV
ncbi:MAG: AAA family ATPase [Gammaproteobacteria bacterium]|nr:AAA family ATPase [Gammaproteobacteria bacterium]